MLVTVLLSLSAAAAVPPAQPERRPKCVRPNAILAAPVQGRGWRLDQTPPGRLELAVVREVERCPIPAVLRENIGRR
jgi:hypothetical protein